MSVDCNGLWTTAQDTLILICCQNIYFPMAVSVMKSHCHECHQVVIGFINF